MAKGSKVSESLEVVKSEKLQSRICKFVRIEKKSKWYYNVRFVGYNVYRMQFSTLMP